MKLIPVIFYGHTAVDKRFSSPMLPWIVSEIRRTQHAQKISVCVEEGCFRAYNADFELEFSHRVALMTRFSQADLDPCTFLYLFKGELGEQQREVLYCYLFQATKATDVTDLYRQMKEQSHHHQQQQHTTTRSISNAANLTSLCVDISPSCSSFFEVLYIGKLKVWNKKVPETFIDDALDKFRLHELEKTKKSNDGIEQIKSSQSTTSLNEAGVTNNESDEQINKSTSLQNITTNETTEPDKKQNTSNNLPVEIDDHNRTMVLQVDRTDLRLISPDRKVVLMHKHHKEVTTCMQAIKNSEHFGFVCRETNTQASYVGYVFKCESQSVANDAVQAITQAFANAAATSTDRHNLRNAITSCEHCPMVWYHKLCSEVEHLSDRKTQAAIFRRIDQLDDDDQNTILTKFRGAETDSITEQNEFLMMLLRAHCEMKQARHVHDTAENRSEFLNQYLGGAGNTLFTKAKRSLTNSFDHLLKRKASRDDFGGAGGIKELSLPVLMNSRETSPVVDQQESTSRSRTSTISSQNDDDQQAAAIRRGSISPEHNTDEKSLKSPMMDIFLKVGSSPSTNAKTSSADGSWRQAIFKRVMTPTTAKNNRQQLREQEQQHSSDEEGKKERKMRSREELKEMWKRAIHQAILLVRMEKENAKIKAKQEENAVKRIKLEYDEMRTNQREVMEVWDMVTNRESRVKCDNQMLLHAIRQGVPRSKRGDVWIYLAEQFCSKLPPIDTTKYPNYNVPYETWLKQLTSHQHAILIDLGRTFPSHSYYSSPLGPGQLALFNLLKAYSLLDPEVGYCQGLSFVAGVLLLHMDESQAFFLLRHLMFRRGLRKQYLPDMVALQVKLYQLSRLVRDRLPELYEHFDVHEVSPTLYAAPWLLTIFASQFPLGFVTRVFDLIFLENIDVIFRVALALLTHHREKLLKCDSFEEIMDYLKSKLPTIDACTLDKIMKQVFTTDVSKQLEEYKVEYQVIQEEMISVQPQIEALQRLEVQNKVLTEQNKALTAQLEIALSNVQRLEKTRTLQQANINKLEMQNRTYEVTIATLGSFINNLMDQKLDVEIPGDVRRIISQITISERRRSSDIRNTNLIKVLGGLNNSNNRSSPEKAMVKSLSTGRITTNTVTPIINERANSLNTTGQQQQQQQQQQKVSNFFSSTHTNILQKQLSQQSLLSSLNNNSTKIDIKIQDFEANSPADSGVGTPSSPNNNNNDVVHPLSNCGDVNFTFNGTRELKTIKAGGGGGGGSTKHSSSMLSRNSSPDITGHTN